MTKVTASLIPVNETFENASDADIAEIERLSAARLPGPYREFLKQFGNSMFNSDAVVTSELGTELPIMIFFGGGRGEGSVVDELLLHADLEGRQLIPIANDMMNNRFFLDCAQGGRVRFLDYTTRGPRAEDVCDSFESLWDRIKLLAE